MITDRLMHRLKDLRSETPLSLARRVGRKLRHTLAEIAESRTDWRRRKRVVDREFDERFGVATGGVTHLSDLDIESEHRRHGVNHVAMDPSEMEAALSSLTIDHTRFTFVDLGSGKARALLLASLLPFRRIVGVEFAEVLHQQALANVSRFRHPEQRCRDIELKCMDAALYELPAEPLVIFMYHPFGPEVMSRVVAHTRASLEKHPRELYVLYANPFNAELWTQAGFDTVTRGPTFMLLAPGELTRAEARQVEA
jgi:hypothetical protein